MRCWRSLIVERNTSPDQSVCGRIEAVSSDGFDVRTGAGTLRILELQMPGRRRVGAGDFVRGHDVSGKILGS